MITMRGFLGALIFLLLIGCAPKVVTVTEQVYVPVQVPCPTPDLEAFSRPELAVSKLTDDSSPAEVQKALVLTIKALMGYSERLETVLDGYRSAP